MINDKTTDMNYWKKKINKLQREMTYWIILYSLNDNKTALRMEERKPNSYEEWMKG